MQIYLVSVKTNTRQSSSIILTTVSILLTMSHKKHQALILCTHHGLYTCRFNNGNHTRTTHVITPYSRRGHINVSQILRGTEVASGCHHVRSTLHNTRRRRRRWLRRDAAEPIIPAPADFARRSSVLTALRLSIIRPQLKAFQVPHLKTLNRETNGGFDDRRPMYGLPSVAAASIC